MWYFGYRWFHFAKNLDNACSIKLGIFCAFMSHYVCTCMYRKLCFLCLHLVVWLRVIKGLSYCKSGNIRGTLIFVNFAQNSASAILKNPQIYWQYFVCTWVLMQMVNILENVWGLLCFCAAQLLVNVSYDVKYLCNKKISSEHLLSANSTTRKYVFVLPNAKNLSRKINSIYSICTPRRQKIFCEVLLLSIR